MEDFSMPPRKNSKAKQKPVPTADALEAYEATLRSEVRKPAPKNAITVRLDPDIYALVGESAVRAGVSMNAWVTRLVVEKLEPRIRELDPEQRNVARRR